MPSISPSPKAFLSQALSDLDTRQRVLYILLGLSAAATPVSIAVTQSFYAMGGLAWLWRPGRWRSFPRLPIRWPLLLCVVTTLLAVLGSGSPQVSAGALKKFLLFLLPFMAVEVWNSERRVSLVLGAMSVTSAGSTVLAYFQYPGSSELDRVTGFLGHWQTYAGQQMMIFLLASAMLLWISFRSWFFLGLLLISGSGLLISETRGAWLGSLFALFLLVLMKDRRLALGLAALLALGFLALPAHLKTRAYSIFDLKMESNAARLNMWQTGLRMIAAHPVLGVGPSRITATAYDYGGNPRYEPRFFMHLHNNYLQLAAERGIPGLLAWLWLLFRFYADLAGFLRRRAGSPAGLSAALLWGCVAALTGIVVAGFMEFNLGDSEVLMMLLALMSCAYGLHWRSSKSVSMESCPHNV